MISINPQAQSQQNVTRQLVYDPRCTLISWNLLLSDFIIISFKRVFYIVVAIHFNPQLFTCWNIVGITKIPHFIIPSWICPPSLLTSFSQLYNKTKACLYLLDYSDAKCDLCTFRNLLLGDKMAILSPCPLRNYAMCVENADVYHFLSFVVVVFNPFMNNSLIKVSYLYENWSLQSIHSFQIKGTNTEWWAHPSPFPLTHKIIILKYVFNGLAP